MWEDLLLEGLTAAEVPADDPVPVNDALELRRRRETFEMKCVTVFPWPHEPVVAGGGGPGHGRIFPRRGRRPRLGCGHDFDDGDDPHRNVSRDPRHRDVGEPRVRRRGRPRRARCPRLRVALSRRPRDGRRPVDHVTKPRSAPGPVLRFATAADFEAWLDANHDRHPGIWLEIAKKGSRDRSVSYAEAIELALCFGWIDGQKRRGDDEHWLQRFTPRSTRSRWSKINRDKAEQLIAAGRMRPAGLTEVDRARVDGRWAAAYEGQRDATIPDDLAHELDRDPKAAAAFAKLDAQNRYSIVWRINDAKRPETRARRVAKYLDMLRRGERIHG